MLDKCEEWECYPDLPHEEYMVDNGIGFEGLPKNLQLAIQSFDNQYLQATSDGHISEQEEKDLVHQSFKVEQLLKKEFEQQDNHPKKSGGNGWFGVLFGLLLGGAIGYGVGNANKA